MSTLRLYFEQPSLDAFDATVVAHGRIGGRLSVVLDRSAFYPESGGQMADRGSLGGSPVTDVQIDEGLVVHHVLDGAAPDIGSTVSGAIDRPRRRAHAALHSAQHILSRALLEVAGAETVSSRLGETACTIDVSVPAIAEAKLLEAESLVNALVDEDRPVRAWFPTDEELAALPLRRAPKQKEGIRVVDFLGFDVSPCGGTHVARTAQVGLFRVTKLERYKGGTRVTFSAGPRARAEVATMAAALERGAALMSVPPTEIDAGITRLMERGRAELEAAGRLRSELATLLARDARPDAEGRVVIDIGSGGLELARQLAAMITRAPGRVAVIGAAIESGTHWTVMRSADVSVDCGALLRRLATAAGGKGGGRPEHAEGRLPRDFDVAAALIG